MPAIQRVLVAVDYSLPCRSAMRYAGLLARRVAATLTVVHVAAAGGSEHKAAAELEGFCHAVEPEAGMAPVPVLLRGTPGPGIVRFAEATHSDLIVMPTRGHDQFRQLLLGSVTTYVLDHSHNPVFTGAYLEHSAAAHACRFENVVCGVDFSEQSGRALEWAAWLCAQFEARLFIVHAVPALEPQESDYFRRQGDTGPAQKAFENLEDMRRQVGYPAKLIVVGGDAATAVCRQVSELGSDLLVVGRGEAGGRVGRLRSTVSAILRGAHCPVVSV